MRFFFFFFFFFFTKFHRHKDCMSFLSCFVILVHPVHLAWYSAWPLPCPLYELTAHITRCHGNKNECPPLPRPVRKQVFVVSQYRHFCVQKWLHFFCRSCFAELWFFPWVLPCICRTGSVYESFIINFLLGFHIFGELFRLQAEKLIF